MACEVSGLLVQRVKSLEQMVEFLVKKLDEVESEATKARIVAKYVELKQQEDHSWRDSIQKSLRELDKKISGV